jgi:preprotein translocase subunit SecA
VIGSERHESRRIDNQLRGRSGRQGDAGSSRFYLSLQDDLMRIFASDKVGSLMKKLGMEEGEAIEHPWVNRAIENAQRKVEGHNYDIRKQLLEYDNVANDQLKVIYAQRNEMMAESDLSGTVKAIRDEVVNSSITACIPHGSIDEQWDIEGLEKALAEEFGQSLPIVQWLDQDNMLDETGLRRKILSGIVDEFEQKEQQVGSQGMRDYEKHVMLNVLDKLWKEHLAAMDYLRQSIGLRGYAQKDPKQEYKREAFEMFTELLERMKYEVVSTLSLVKIQPNEPVNDYENVKVENVHYQHAAAEGMQQPDAEPGQESGSQEAGEKAAAQPYHREQKKIGRNDPCYCGSGKKFKQCHGKLT